MAIPLSEKIRITRKQYEVLNVVCNIYEKSVSEYMQEAIVEAMKSDIGEGNFCDALVDKLDGDDDNKEERMIIESSTNIENETDSLHI